MIRKIIEAENTTSNQEKEDWFIERTNRHIALVQQAAKKIVAKYPEFQALLDQVQKHDASKFEEPERTPYVSISWRHKLENDGFDPINGKGYQTPGLLDKKDENQATLHHIRTNSHHPEFHNQAEANLSPECRDKSLHCIDASAMPDIDIAEMIADWQAMTEELKKNTTREWFNKQQDVRWHFSPHQVELIDKLIKVFEISE